MNWSQYSAPLPGQSNYYLSLSSEYHTTKHSPPSDLYKCMSRQLWPQVPTAHCVMNITCMYHSILIKSTTKNSQLSHYQYSKTVLPAWPSSPGTNYSASVGQRSIVIRFVCLSASISLELLDRSSQIILCRSLWRRLGPPLAALCYAMYFRFYGWCHVWP